MSRPCTFRPRENREVIMKAILFVDDHQVLATLSCEILEMQGYRAVSAYSGADALSKFEQDDFGVLVTDFRMEGMNGLELARKVHEKHPDVSHGPCGPVLGRSCLPCEIRRAHV